MNRILELNSLKDSARKKFWMKTWGMERSWTWIHCPPEVLQAKSSWDLATRDSDLILVDENFSEAVLLNQKQVPLNIQRSRFVDTMARKRDSGLWMYGYLTLSFQRLLVEKAPGLQMARAAYIVGSGPVARAMTVELIQMGFKKFFIVSPDENQVRILITELKKNFFDIYITPLKTADLPLQPNNGSIVVNTVGLREHSELQEDLGYLNFIEGDGVLVDASPQFTDHPLLIEARSVGIKTISAVEIFGCRDWLILSEHQSSLDLNLEDYLDLWESYLVSEDAAKV